MAVDRARPARASVTEIPQIATPHYRTPPTCHLAVSSHCRTPGCVLESAGHGRFRHPVRGVVSFDPWGGGAGVSRGRRDRGGGAPGRGLLVSRCHQELDRRRATRRPTAAASTGSSTGRPHPSRGCAGAGRRASAAVSGQRQDLTVDGVDRWYLLTTPPTRPGTGPLPLVVDAPRSRRGRVASQADTTQFGPKAQADGFIVVFPEGTGSPVSWDIDPSTTAHPNHDLDFMNAMLDSLESAPVRRRDADLCHGSVRRRAVHVAAGLHHGRSLRRLRRRWPAPWSPHRAIPGRQCRSSPSTAPPTRSSTSTGAWAPRCLNNALSGKTVPTTAAATRRASTARATRPT